MLAGCDWLPGQRDSGPLAVNAAVGRIPDTAHGRDLSLEDDLEARPTVSIAEDQRSVDLVRDRAKQIDRRHANDVTRPADELATPSRARSGGLVRSRSSKGEGRCRACEHDSGQEQEA
jgi:hypothetical protein